MSKSRTRPDKDVTLNDLYVILAGDKFGKEDGVVRQLRNVHKELSDAKEREKERDKLIATMQQDIQKIKDRPSFLKGIRAVASYIGFLKAPVIT